MTKHRITVGEEIRYDADVQSLRGLSGTYVQITATEKILTPTGDPPTDAAAINAAISAISTLGGGRVRLAGAAWAVSTSLTPRSGVTLTMDPGGSIRHTANSYVFFAQNVAFDGFTLDGVTFIGPVNEFPTAPKRSRTTSGNGTVSAVYMSGDIDATGTGQAQLKNFTMRNCAVKGCTGLPIRIGGVRGKVSVTNCDFLYNFDAGFVFCEDVTFNDNYVYGSGDNGVSLSRGCTKVTCVGNTIENCAYNGIWVTGFQTDLGPTNFTVVGNVVKNIGFNGIIADLAPQHGVISGNEIDCGYYRGPTDQATDINGAGIYLGGYPTNDRANPTAYVTNVNVFGNQIRRAARAGIYISGAKDCQVIGNLINDIGTQYLADGTTAIASSDASQNVGVLVEQPTVSANLVVALNKVVDRRATPYCNFGLVPQSVSTVEAFYNSMTNCRNASNLLETGNTARTVAATWSFQSSTKFPGGAVAGSNAGSGTISGFDVNGASGSARPFRIQTGGVDRWHVRGGTNAESGSNTGTDLELAGRDDTGGALNTVASFSRVGAVTLGVNAQPVTLKGRRVSAAAAATVAAGAQSATAAAASNGANDSSGTVNTTAVASPIPGTIATVTFATAYAAIPKVTLTPRNQATALAGLYTISETTGGFGVATAGTPSASASLSFHYQVEG